MTINEGKLIPGGGNAGVGRFADPNTTLFEIKIVLMLGNEDWR